MATKKTVADETAAIETVETKAAEAETVETVAEEAAPKKTAKKTTARKTTKKDAAETAEKKETTAKKTTARRKKAKESVMVQFGGKEIVVKDVVDAASKAFQEANEGVVIETIELYIKPEEGVAYYAVNGNGSEDYKVEL